MNGVILSPNIKKESVRIDSQGNVIDPKTKQIIKPNVPDYIPTKEEIEGLAKKQTVPQETKTNLSITEQIAEAEKRLADLKLQKQQEIARMKEELKKLEAS